MADALTRFPLSGPINLSVRTGQGSVTVHARDDLTEAVVRLSARGPGSSAVERTSVSLDGPTLTIQGPRQGGGLGDMFGLRHKQDSVEVEVEVPSGTAMKVTTGTADIAVTGRAGGADLGTGTGAIEVATIDGDLRVRSGSSDVHIERVTGATHSRTGSGDVTLIRIKFIS